MPLYFLIAREYSGRREYVRPSQRVDYEAHDKICEQTRDIVTLLRIEATAKNAFYVIHISYGERGAREGTPKLRARARAKRMACGVSRYRGKAEFQVFEARGVRRYKVRAHNRCIK